MLYLTTSISSAKLITQMENRFMKMAKTDEEKAEMHKMFEEARKDYK